MYCRLGSLGSRVEMIYHSRFVVVVVVVVVSFPWVEYPWKGREGSNIDKEKLN